MTDNFLGALTTEQSGVAASRTRQYASW